MYTQLIAFDKSKGGNEKDNCLGNTRIGFSIPNGVYKSAWLDWLNTDQHTEPIPDGVDVPVSFSYWATIDGIYANWGHKGVRLADGTFWSDGKVYPSIEAYTSTHAPKYLGWSTSLEGIQVITEGAEMQDQIDKLYVALDEANKRAESDRADKQRLWDALDAVNKRLDSMEKQPINLDRYTIQIVKK